MEIEAERPFIESFVLQQEMLSNLLSIYVLSTKVVNSQRVRTEMLRRVAKQLQRINIGVLNTAYLRKIYGLVVAVYNNF